tara:strand:- start:9520 stop:10797 length:1278 start_codon:yes stop_codon:yes gene_type:complete
MIKLEEFQLTGYKNITEANLTFDSVNVIIGPNNSGKSNFIQSISFLDNLINSSSDELKETFDKGFSSTHFGEIAPREKYRAVYNKANKGSTEFRLKISNSTTNRIFSYGLKIDWSSIKYNVKYKISKEYLDVKDPSKPGKASNIFTRVNNEVKYGSEFSKTSVLETVPDSFSVIRILKLISGITDNEEYMDAISSLNELVKSPIFYFSHTELAKSKNSERIGEFNGRTVSFNLEKEIMALEENKKNWNIFNMALKNTLNISSVSVMRISKETLKIVSADEVKPNEEVFKFLSFWHMGDSKELTQLSDGSILIVALITKVLSSDEDLIFIEEPENSTHPKALLDLLAFLKSFSITKQFIISSHSIALLNKSKINEVIISSVNEMGYSQLFNVKSQKELKTRLRQSHVNFSDELFFNNPLEEENFEF